MSDQLPEGVCNRGKVFVIGFDGANFDLIEPWVNQGRLPTFAKLMTEEVRARLKSPAPQSPPAWAYFMTGKNPGKHGIHDFAQPKGSLSQQTKSYRVGLVRVAANSLERIFNVAH